LLIAKWCSSSVFCALLVPAYSAQFLRHVCVAGCVGGQGDEPAPEDEEEYEADEAEDDSEGSDEGESDGGDEVRMLRDVM
jgi:hypothetical protein